MNAAARLLGALVALLALAGCVSHSTGTPTRVATPERVQFRLVVQDLPAANTTEPRQPNTTEFPGRDGHTYLLGPALLDGTQIADATAAADQNAGGQWQVTVTMTTAGARTLGDVTSTHVGEAMAVVVNGTVITAPVVQTPIAGGSMVINGNFTAAEASTLADAIRGR